MILAPQEKDQETPPMAKLFKRREKNKKINPANHGSRPNWGSVRRSKKKKKFY
jgi:hypothetical protein